MSKPLKLSDIILREDTNVIHCPSRDGHHIHHESVEIFNRSEDSKDGIHVLVSEHEVITDRNLKGNPSSRCHGLIVYFCCEECSAIIKMKLYQHKGSSFVGMVFGETE